MSSLSLIPFAMTSITPTPPSAAHQFNCLTFGNPVSSHRDFLLYLRYISDETQVKTLQASLNKSLSTTMHVYGHPTALLSDTGIPSLYITQNLQLAQLRFRLHSSPPSTIQHFLWCLWQPLLQALPLDTLEDRMQNAVGQVDPPRRDPNSPMPHNVTLSKPLTQ